MIKITIAIPVYNVEQYVEKSLLSALDQDFALPYEVLVVDDCGSDGSMEVVSSVMLSHPRGGIVRVVKHQCNKGLGEARNTAINEAKGRYLFFLDSDDWIVPDCLSVLYRRAVATGAEVTVGGVKQVDAVSGEIKVRRKYRNRVVSCKNVGVYMCYKGIPMHIEAWNKLMLVDFLRSNNLRTVHRIMEDSIFDFNMRVALRKVAFVKDITLFYNIREGSILTSIFDNKSSDESVYVYCDIIDKCRDLIKTRYADMKGIYDLYMLRIRYSLSSLNRSVQTEEQRLMIENTFHTSVSFVPGVASLHSISNKLAYRFCQGKSSSKEILAGFLRADRLCRRLHYWNPFVLAKAVSNRFWTICRESGRLT